MASAVNIAEVLIEHAKAAFALMHADPAMECAKKIFDWIARSQEAPLTSFAARDCFNSLRGKYRRMADLNVGLAILEGHGILRKSPVVYTGKAGRPSTVFFVNPEAFKGQYAYKK